MITTVDSEFIESKYRIRVGVRGGMTQTVAGTDDYDEAKEFMRHIMDVVTAHHHPLLTMPASGDPRVFKQDFITIGDMAIDMDDINIVCIESFDVTPKSASVPIIQRDGPVEPYDIVREFYNFDTTEDTPTVSEPAPMDDVVQE